MLELLKRPFRPLFFYLKNIYEKKKFEKLLAGQKGKDLKIVVGSAGIYDKGWLPSEAHFLDLLDAKDWDKYFGPDAISVVMAEHVWEHLSVEQGKRAAENCHRFLKSGGRMRVAVPDGFHPDANYINSVKPGGSGAGSLDHKVLYNYKTFGEVFASCGFEVKLLEYFDEQGVFHRTDWDRADGYIHRSIRYDSRNVDGKPIYTSLMLDAVKK